MIVNVTFAVPFAIWMMRAFLAAVPIEIEEAARLDGASRLTILRRIVLPLIAPGVASVAIFAFVSSWTEYLFASVLIQSDAHKTIPVGLAGIIGQYQVDWGLDAGGGHHHDTARDRALRLHRPLFRRGAHRGRDQVTGLA